MCNSTGTYSHERVVSGGVSSNEAAQTAFTVGSGGVCHPRVAAVLCLVLSGEIIATFREVFRRANKPGTLPQRNPAIGSCSDTHTRQRFPRPVLATKGALGWRPFQFFSAIPVKVSLSKLYSDESA